MKSGPGERATGTPLARGVSGADELKRPLPPCSKAEEDVGESDEEEDEERVAGKA